MPRGKERIVICVDCGAEIKTTTSRTQRCKACAYERIKERARQKAAQKSVELAKQEKTPYVMEDYHFCDSPENIQKCLNCTRKKCGNCLGYAYKKKTEGRAG
jgi:hypothetical protein